MVPSLVEQPFPQLVRLRSRPDAGFAKQAAALLVWRGVAVTTASITTAAYTATLPARRCAAPAAALATASLATSLAAALAAATLAAARTPPSHSLSTGGNRK